MKRYDVQIGLCLLICLSACDAPDIEEISRVPSLDGRVEAVIEVANYHSTVPFVTRVYIVPRGGLTRDGQERLRAEVRGNLKVEWNEPHLLVAKYRNAQVYSFINTWSSEQVDEWQYKIEVRLEPQDYLFPGPWEYDE